MKVVTWLLAVLLFTTVVSLSFVPIVESISTGQPHFVPTTIFQHPGIPGPSNHIAKAALYASGIIVFLAAALCLPIRHGVLLTGTIFSFSVFLTTRSIRGLVGGWVLLPAWSLLAVCTLLSGALFWLKLVELHRTKKEGQHAVAGYASHARKS